MNFELTKEQKAVWQTVREFREKYLDKRDYRDWLEPEPRKRFPWDLIKASHRHGIKTLMAPVEDGGCGGDPISIFLAGEEIAYGEFALSTLLGHQWSFTKMLVELTNDEQKELFYRPFLKEEDYLTCTALTEDTVGSDGLVPYNNPKFGPQTKAVRDGDYWIINGRKQFCTAGAFAKICFLFARTDFTKGIWDGLTLMVVPMNTKGVRIGEVYDKIGDRANPNAEIWFEDVAVPVKYALGQPNQAFEAVGPLLDMTYLTNVAAPACGLAKASYDHALQWCKDRVQGGKPIIEHQAVGLELAEMKIMIELCRNISIKAAWSTRYGGPVNEGLPVMAKIVTSEMVPQIVRKAFELFGGYAIMRPNKIEKYYRDAAILYHGDGTIPTNKMKIWNRIRGVPYLS